MDPNYLLFKNAKKDVERLRSVIHPEYQYLQIVEDVLQNGKQYPTFVTQDVKEKFYGGGEPPFSQGKYGELMEFNLQRGFPLFTTKSVHFRSILGELLWFLQGSGNIKFLVDNNVHIWDEWGWKAYRQKMQQFSSGSYILSQSEYIQKVKEDNDFALEYGDIGPVYPVSWRSFKGGGNMEADQIAWVIKGLKKDKTRRHYIVNSWHPCHVYEMAKPGQSVELPPCHAMFHFKVNPDDLLDCSLFQRSADLFLGVPFNVASYSLLTIMIAQIVGVKPGKFVHFLADYHLYENQIEPTKIQLAREPKPLCTVEINPDIKNIDNFCFEDFELVNYLHHPKINADVVPVGGVN